MSLKGLNYGARRGFQFGSFQLGADYLQSNLKASGGNNDDDFKVQELSALLGYHFSYFRIYGGLIVDSKVQDSVLDSGDGFKVGLSFYLLRNMAFNLKYRYAEFKSIAPDGRTIDANYNQLGLLVSYPFAF